MAKVLVSDLAKLDLIDIWQYIAQDNYASADRWIGKIEKVFEMLARGPGLGRERGELAPSLRSFPVGDYVIFYKPIKGGILVARVLSGYRDIDSLFH